MIYFDDEMDMEDDVLGEGLEDDMLDDDDVVGDDDDDMDEGM